MTYLDILDEVASECYYDGTIGYEPLPRHSEVTISHVGSGSNSDVKEKPEPEVFIDSLTTGGGGIPGYLKEK